jgi:hypothetical protein
MYKVHAGLATDTWCKVAYKSRCSPSKGRSSPPVCSSSPGLAPSWYDTRFAARSSLPAFGRSPCSFRTESRACKPLEDQLAFGSFPSANPAAGLLLRLRRQRLQTATAWHRIQRLWLDSSKRSPNTSLWINTRSSTENAYPIPSELAGAAALWIEG